VPQNYAMQTLGMRNFAIQIWRQQEV